MGPTVSICMPTYNQARFLPEAIESVLGQSYQDFEFIIIDDHSTDASAEIIGRYAASDPRILFRVNDRNAGLVRNWNNCLALARGEYIKYLFGDDLLSTTRALEQYVMALDGNPDVVLVASSRYHIDEHSNVLNVVSDYMGARVSEGPPVIIDSLIDQQNNIGEPSAVIFRRRNAVRGFHEQYRQIVDLEMWFHLLEQGKFAYIDEPLCSFRLHPDQATKRNFEEGLYLDDSSHLLRDYAGKPYVRISRFKRAFMHFAPAYGIWKLYKKHGRISRSTALENIRDRYGFRPLVFIAFKPLFRMYKYYRRYAKRTMRHFLAAKPVFASSGKA